MKKVLMICGIAILLIIVTLTGCVENKEEKERKTQTISDTVFMESSELYALVINDDIYDLRKGDTITWEWKSDYIIDFEIYDIYTSTTDSDTGSFQAQPTEYTFTWETNLNESEMWSEYCDLTYTIKIIPEA